MTSGAVCVLFFAACLAQGNVEAAAMRFFELLTSLGCELPPAALVLLSGATVAAAAQQQVCFLHDPFARALSHTGFAFILRPLLHQHPPPSGMY
jgi:hypothetical protein